MKKYTILFLALVSILVTGCPVGVDYPLGKPGDTNIDERMVGTWHNEREGGEVLSVTITKRDKESYDVLVLERGEMYALETDKLTAWVTTIGDHKFFYAKPEGEEKFYHYHYDFDGKKLVTHDVSLLVGGIDAVTSTEAFREEVKGSIGKEGWGDELSTWKKD